MQSAWLCLYFLSKILFTQHRLLSTLQCAVWLLTAIQTIPHHMVDLCHSGRLLSCMALIELICFGMVAAFILLDRSVSLSVVCFILIVCCIRYRSIRTKQIWKFGRFGIWS